MPELDQPEQSYFPSARVRLVVRFDEFDDAAAAKATNDKVKKRPHRKRGTVDPDAPLVVQTDPDAPPGVTRFVLAPKGGGSPASAPQKTTGDVREQVIGDMIPKTATLNLNGIRQADTLDVALRFGDCPFDPRVIRSARVYFYLGTVTANEYQRGVAGQKIGDLDPNHQQAQLPLNVVRDDYQDPDTGQRVSNLRFQGWVDEWEVERGEDSEPLLRLKCRDHTQLLIDATAPPNLVVASDQPIDKAVATYLSNFSQMQGFSVEYRPPGATPPSLGSSLQDTAFRPDLGPVPSKGGGAGASKTSVLDYLTDVTAAMGHTLRFEGSTLVIQTPRTLLGLDFKRDDAAFQGRDLPGGRAAVRRFVYGRDVLEMRMVRKYARRGVTNVEVRSYNAAKKTTLVVRFPVAKDDTANKPQPGEGVEQKWLVIRVAGIKDKKTLRLVAQSYYEQVGRNEVAVHLRTKNLASFGGDNASPDLLSMQAGDAFEILDFRAEVGRDPSPNVNNVAEAKLYVAGQARHFLGQLGFDEGSELVRQYAEAYANKGVLVLYRLQSMNIAWDADSEGVTIEPQGANYLLRDEKKLPEGEEPTP